GGPGGEGEGNPRGSREFEPKTARGGSGGGRARGVLLRVRRGGTLPELDSRVGEEEARGEAGGPRGQGGVRGVEGLPGGSPCLQGVARRTMGPGEGSKA